MVCVIDIEWVDRYYSSQTINQIALAFSNGTSKSWKVMPDIKKCNHSEPFSTRLPFLGIKSEADLVEGAEDYNLVVDEMLQLIKENNVTEMYAWGEKDAEVLLRRSGNKYPKGMSLTFPSADGVEIPLVDLSGKWAPTISMKLSILYAAFVGKDYVHTFNAADDAIATIELFQQVNEKNLSEEDLALGCIKYLVDRLSPVFTADFIQSKLPELNTLDQIHLTYKALSQLNTGLEALEQLI